MDPELSGEFLAALVAYLERAGGPDLVDEARAQTGLEVVRDPERRSRWVRASVLLELAGVAGRLTGDVEIGRRTGEELFRRLVADPDTKASFVALGTPSAALDELVTRAANLARGRAYRVVERGDGVCVVEARFDTEHPGHPFFCGVSLGHWSMVPSLFGGVGAATHPTCQCRGDDRCTFAIRWDGAAGASAEQAMTAGVAVSQRLRSFEEMQFLAARLARSADLESLAEHILDGMEAITPAPQLLLAVRPGPNRPRIVAGRRMTAETAELWSERLLADDAHGGPPVTAMARLGPFGVMAAIAPDTESTSDTGSRLLEAFARQAEARIEAVLSRLAAEQSRQTADALLELARALTEVTTVQEVSDRLAKGIPSLAGADHSCVMGWEPGSGEMVPLAWVSPDGRETASGFTVTNIPALLAVTDQPGPLLIRRSRCDPYVAEAMARWNEEVIIVVPLVDETRLLGLVCAGYERELQIDAASAFARLKGAADLALTAYGKARLLEEVRHQALHDDLTGLPNRALLESRVERSIAVARRTNQGMALLFLDLDRFKNVNDSMGHNFGDALICCVAERIGQCLSADDFLARMGGDEFVVVLDGVTSADEAEAVGERILAQLRLPVDIDGHSLYVSASIGIAVYPEDGVEYGALLQTADSSMYAAKGAGRGAIRRRAHAPDAAAVHRRLQLETELHRALERDEITVLYQPQVDLADLSVIGVEALIRWQHPEQGLVSPAEFLSVAEECGLLPALDRRVRQLAFAQARKWQERAGSLTVSVNLAAQTLCRPGLLHEVAEDLTTSGIDPTAIEVELTEGMVDDDELIPVVEGLAAMGFRVAIDDFGTGASVFARLQRLPVNTLKIDRSLVQVGRTRRETSILGAIIRMSHSMGLTVVAEGVETDDQAARLGQEGCDAGQGFLFGRPTTATEIEAMLPASPVYLDRHESQLSSPRRQRNRLPA